MLDGRRALTVVFLGLLAACGHKPPYGRGQEPAPDALMDQTHAQLDAMTVAEASITLNRVARGDLALLAQTPDRFRGTVSKSGNELVTLAFHGEGYGLRYKLDGIPVGFYEGPPSKCAVEAMLGVPFSYEGLVALVLGGGPVIDQPYELLDQHWDRKGGFEAVVLGNAEFEQELRFAWVDGTWTFTGAMMWRRRDGKRAEELWELQHSRHAQTGDAVLPGKTKVRAPGPKRDTIIIINYKDRDLDPPWVAEATPTTGTTTPAKDPTDSGWESDGWDDEGWENDDEEDWEDGDETTTTTPDPGQPDSAANHSPQAPAAIAPAGAVAASPPTAAAVSPIPEVFRVDGTGLTARGDLCR